MKQRVFDAGLLAGDEAAFMVRRLAVTPFDRGATCRAGDAARRATTSVPDSRKRAGHDATRSRGVLSLELVLTLPILGVVLMGLFEFTLLFYARGQVVEASRAGARHASLPGAAVDDVEATVARVLPPRLRNGIAVATDLGEHSGDVVSVLVHVPMTSAAPDLLWPIGAGLSGRTLTSETRMVRE